MLRTGKKSLAIATLLLDALKGYASIIISLLYFTDLIFLSALNLFHWSCFSDLVEVLKEEKGLPYILGIILALSFPLAIVFSIILDYFLH